ncbi:MAG: hypothetical protein ACLFVR_10335 [Thiohalospira sp.]
MKPRKLYLVFPILIFITLLSCNNQKTKEPEFKRLNRWLDYYDLSLNHFTDTLIINDNYSFKTKTDTLSPHFKLFSNLYIYSSQKEYAVDLDSYYLVLEKNHDGRYVCLGTDADQEIALINLKNQERQRIIFCGTACRAEEAQWIDNNKTILIMGFSQPTNTWIPTIWVFNLGNKSLKVIKTYKVQINKKPNSYNKAVRLNDIVFK